MSLIRKEPTEAMVAANRANSLKSSGPVTDPGKMNARLNALKHGLTAAAGGPCLPELGEREEDLKSLRVKLQLAFRADDSFEEMLLQEMAENRWRRRRVLRAEGGMLTAQRLSLEIDYGRKIAGDGRSAAEVGALSLAAALGLVALPDSSAKFSLILQTLRATQKSVEREGFTETALRYLEGVYGPDPGLAGAALLARYRLHLPGSPAARTASSPTGGPEPAAEVGLENGFRADSQEDTARREFAESLTAEIACFEKLLELHEKAGDELARAQWEAQSTLSDPDSRRILRYETFLDRQYERLLKRFHEHREARRQEQAAAVAMLAAGADPLARGGFGAPGSLGLDPNLARAFAGGGKVRGQAGPRGVQDLKDRY